MPTIYALSSGRPPAGIAVIRISGPQAFSTLMALAGVPVPPPRVLTLRSVVDPADGALLDRALVVAFPGPASATGEDLVELHLHGGVAVVAAVLGVLGRQPGLRLAAAGEFTRRAFDNGRLDLAQVEGLADLIDATTEAARRQALAQVGGRLGAAVDRWRSVMIAGLSDIAARLDFAEAEEDVAAGLSDATTAGIGELAGEIGDAIADARRGEQVRDGLTVALTGAPNVGKSSIINALARRDIAIVSEHAGTTRDAIEVRLDLGGVALTLVDTAGLRTTTDPVEREGISRGRRRAAAADLAIAIGTPDASTACLVVNKIDLSGDKSGWRDGRLYLSVATGDGIGALLDWLEHWAASVVRPDEPVLVARERQRLALVAAHTELMAIDDETELVLIAERLRCAAHALRSITGAIGVDDVLDTIFSRFCIGK